MLKTAKNFLLDLVFPPLCLTCENHLPESEKRVCDNCLASLSLYDYLYCPVCLGRDNRCHPRSGYLLAAATSYDHPVIKKIIWQFKYEGWQNLADPLSDLLVNCLRKTGQYSRPDWLVVPLPLYKSRQKKRGFNQSELLAEKVNRQLNLVWSKDNLIRVRNTESQAEMIDYKTREENVKNAFFVNDPEEFNGKNIILIDDVFTSGTTLNEAIRVLRLVGAKKIIALVVARAR